MRDLSDHAARCGIVFAHDRLVELSDTETLYDLLLVFGIADHAPVILDLDRTAFCVFSFLRHLSF